MTVPLYNLTYDIPEEITLSKDGIVISRSGFFKLLESKIGYEIEEMFLVTDSDFPPAGILYSYLDVSGIKYGIVDVVLNDYENHLLNTLLESNS